MDLESIRDVEKRIDRAKQDGRLEGWHPSLTAPDMPRPADSLPQNVPEHMRLMLDLIVLAFLWVAYVVLSVIAFFAILFTGRYPRPTKLSTNPATNPPMWANTATPPPGAPPKIADRIWSPNQPRMKKRAGR